ncbi:hypothetical protein THMIRHAM_00490 [Thiomicrorhabdus immobilis]|uniref:Phosphotyrosine protein phosphatase I domain-containing protein n=1 Tax=Thiomicrorhabdus immobilis TaxID=2791037 RepID=A0ABM7MA98_9GAMM|nr:arsenate reductase ArsC [Thiomicrorhabdus immobilis]BCN92264.1 hypothetical protein THMIRHAM_00490 [Thiomicrorhabdus immobilis]
MYNVLFIDTENATRSIVAEALLNHWGKGKFQAYSAGSEPINDINPHALAVLKNANLSVADAYPKGLDVFSGDDAPQMDFVFILCDKVRNEVCPIWPDHTITAVWDINIPTADDLYIDAVREVLHSLEARIQLFIQLPIAKLEHLKLKQAVAEISQQ